MAGEVLRINICAKNPPLRKAPKRWWQHYDDSNAEKKPQKK